MVTILGNSIWNPYTPCGRFWKYVPRRGCESDTHEVYMWYPWGVHVISMRCTCDTHEVYMWYPCGVHVIPMRCTCDIHVVYMWYPGDWVMGYSIWNPYTPCGRFWKYVPRSGCEFLHAPTFCVILDNSDFALFVFERTQSQPRRHLRSHLAMQRLSSEAMTSCPNRDAPALPEHNQRADIPFF